MYKRQHLALVREKIVAEKTRLETLEQQREQRVADLKASQDQRARAVGAINQQIKTRGGELKQLQSQAKTVERLITCLLYTSDAADERSSVDLGGRRIINTKNITTSHIFATDLSNNNHHK